MTFDQETIMAYVDGECDAVAAKRIENAMKSDVGLAQRVSREKSLREKLAVHYDPVVQEEIPDRLTALLTASATSNVDSSFTDRKAKQQHAQKQRSGIGFAQWGAMAATLAVGVAVGQFGLGGQSNAPFAQDGGTLIANGSLENALEKQLASAQTNESDFRIGLTFRAKSGNICRTFKGEAVSGIACREGQQWQMRSTLPGGPSGDYRQASSGEINAIVADMMTDGPVDADSERKLRDGGWK